MKDLAEDIQAIGWKAQIRLCQRFRRLAATGKLQPKVTTAIARELVGYAWDIARHVEGRMLREPALERALDRAMPERQLRIEEPGSGGPGRDRDFGMEM